VAVGTMEILLLPEAEAEVYSYENKVKYENRVRYRLVRPADEPLIGEVERLTLVAWRVLNCRDGGRVDVRCDAAGRPSFIEVNPLPGLNPDHSDLPIVCGFAGVSYVDLIDRIVASARRRIERHARAKTVLA
jgi:D-alanine-D-alanine ligase